MGEIMSKLLLTLLIFLGGCAVKHEPYYEEDTEEAYTEECYCQGPPSTEVRYEDQK